MFRCPSYWHVFIVLMGYRYSFLAMSPRVLIQAVVHPMFFAILHMLWDSGENGETSARCFGTRKQLIFLYSWSNTRMTNICTLEGVFVWNKSTPDNWPYAVTSIVYFDYIINVFKRKINIIFFVFIFSLRRGFMEGFKCFWSSHGLITMIRPTPSCWSRHGDYLRNNGYVYE
jgi:hypothetical protein